MKYTCEIRVDDLNLLKCLQEESVASDRGGYKLSDNMITISATDAMAFRATVNSVSKLMVVYEKMRSII
jgi:tRNA threonylcarbamoyladenosine modification (KEOPS) complex  Pcc1 subunit